MQKKTKKMNLTALLIGFITCLTILLASLYLAYEKTLHEAEIFLYQHTITANEKMRVFLNKIKLSLDDINKHGNSCDKFIHNALHRFVLNEPQVSIAYFYNGAEKCASIENFQFNALPKNIGPKFTLEGPIQIEDILQNAFLLQANHQGKSTGVIFPKRILSELLHESSQSFVRHTLCNDKTKKTIYDTTFAHNPFSLSSDTSPIIQMNQLPYLKGVSMHSYLSYQWVWQHFKPHMIVFSLIALSLCLLLVLIIYHMTKHKLSLEYELQQAIKNNQFIPYYQPVIELSTRKFSGVECLMRWEINKLDVLQPDAFIPTAERSGLIKPMTRQIIDTIFSNLGSYAKANQDFHIAINLSPQHFKDRDTFELVVKSCQQYQIKPKQVIFELTEQEPIKESDDCALGIMQDMRKTGFSLAVDDFGTGYSSINYLQRFPFNFLKIDRQFVKAIGSNAVTAQLADSMIDLARNLNLKVIAEGIEKTHHESHLKNRHILYGQGWLYSKALSFNELEEYIKKQT